MKEPRQHAGFRKHRKLAGRIALAAGGILLAAVTGLQLSRHMFESPGYQRIASHGHFEVRQYQPRVVAETIVDGKDRSEATSDGFRRLANYIFGGNEQRDGKSEKISMTSPVEATPVALPTAGEKIAMTTPVESVQRDTNQWLITFTLPSDKRLDQLPKPNDERITLRVREAETVAVLRFPGRLKNADVKKRELLASIEGSGYVPLGPVTLAVYDPPQWVLPPFRRNEVMVPVRRR